MSSSRQLHEGDLLFEPGPERVAGAVMSEYLAFLSDSAIVRASTYDELWRWSIHDLEAFWSSIAAFAKMPLHRAAERIFEPSRLVEGRPSPEGARFFVGAQCNWADLVLSHDPSSLAVVARDEAGARSTLTYGELTTRAAAMAAGLRGHGVGAGDTVAAVLPNGTDAVAAFIASASLGAIWSSCAPEFGTSAMADRFRQIGPKILLTTDSYRYAGRDYDLSSKTADLAASLGDAVVTSPSELASPAELAGAGATSESLRPVAVGFDHPLWILYSSGTTGLPKAIVHGHGGIVLEHLKSLALHSDLRAGSRFFWFTTTGWMMWNYLVGGLLVGATIVLYDGSPMYPDPLALWRMAAEEQVEYFGTSAPYLDACRKAGIVPREELDLRVASIGSTGAPLTPEGFGWASRAVGDDVLVSSVSGGTDVCTAFLAGCPLLPVYAGELQCAALGVDVRAVSPDGRPRVGEVGELAVATPMPSMPIRLWGDSDGSALHAAYFADLDGLWRHGDWVKQTARGTYVLYGRSDATLNRGGVRMGTAEFYQVLDTLEGVEDSLVVDTSELGRPGELIAVVVPAKPTASAGDGSAGGPRSGLEELEANIRSTVREQLSPRHEPDRVVFAEAIPRTLNGKRIEVPIRRILLGARPQDAVAPGSLNDPAALDGLLAALAEMAPG